MNIIHLQIPDLFQTVHLYPLNPFEGSLNLLRTHCNPPATPMQPPFSHLMIITMISYDNKGSQIDAFSEVAPEVIKRFNNGR